MTTNTNEGFMDSVKKDSKAAGYRVASTQISKMARAGLSKVLKSQGFKTKQVNQIMGLLETEIGRAVVSGLLGVIFPNIPSLGKDPRVQKLASELRIDGMTTIGNELINEVMAMVGPGLMEIFNTLPQVSLDDIADETQRLMDKEKVAAVEQVKVPAKNV